MSIIKERINVILSVLLALALIVGFMPNVSKALEQTEEQAGKTEEQQQSPSLETESSGNEVDKQEVDPDANQSAQEFIKSNDKSNETAYKHTLFAKEDFTTYGQDTFSYKSDGITTTITNGVNVEGQKTFKIKKGGTITFAADANIGSIIAASVYASNKDHVYNLENNTASGTYTPLFVVGTWEASATNAGVKTVTLKAKESLWLYGATVLTDDTVTETVKLTFEAGKNIRYKTKDEGGTGEAITYDEWYKNVPFEDNDWLEKKLYDKFQVPAGR
ncbi:MAG: hypothetical protein HUJ63_10490 [Enterococcus sp.]|nr:hypothetical protein [Enterococcus sp.]